MKSHRCPVLRGLIAAVLLAASPQILVAEVFVNPAPLGAYFWHGSHDGNQIGNLIGNNSPITFTGDGDAGNWARNWNGRYQVTADSGCQSGCQPGVFMGLPPQDGDTFFLTHAFVPVDVHHAVALPSLALPSSDFVISYDASFGGGSLTMDAIFIYSAGGNPQVAFPMEFAATTFVADQLDIVATSTILMNVVDLSAETATLSGHNGAINFIGSTINASTLEILGAGPFSVTLDDSTLQTLGVNVGSSQFPVPQGTPPSELIFTGASTATIAQYLIIGADVASRVTIAGDSHVMAEDAYVNVGDFGDGDLRVTGNSTLAADVLHVGILKRGSVSVDTDGKIDSDSGFVGIFAGHDGTVNLETGGSWEVENLTLGDRGTGYVFVRNGGTLKIEDEGALGLHPTGRGVLNLIGANSHLEVVAGATLAIGKEGTGELNMSEGATFTSAGAVKLGEVDGGQGIVTVDGDGSHWTVQGKLTIGDKNRGRVEVKNQGKLTVAAEQIELGAQQDSDGTLTVEGDESEVNIGTTLSIGQQGKGHVEVKDGAKLIIPGDNVFLGTQNHGDGTLILDGEGTTLDFDGTFVVADQGKGKLRLKNGANFTTGALTLGKAAGSEGTLELKDSETGLEAFVIEGDLTVGKGGRGIVHVEGGYQLTTDGTVIIGEETGSGTEAEPNQVKLSDAKTHWLVDGNLTLGKAANAFSRIDIHGDAKVTSNGAFFTIGEEQDSHGVLHVHAKEPNAGSPPAAMTLNGLLRIGVHGHGEMIIEEKSGAVFRNVKLGTDIYGHGSLTTSGGGSLVRVVEDIDIGGLGVGEVEILDGAELVVQGPFGVVIDSLVPAGASLTVSGTADSGHDPASVDAPRIVVGEAGFGELTVSSGAIAGSLETEMLVAINASSLGSVTVSDGGSLNVANLTAAAQGDATIDVASDASITAAAKITLGSLGTSGSTTFTIDNAQVTAAEIVALTGTTTTLKNNGKLLLKAGGVLSTGGSVAQPATLNVESSGQLTGEGDAAGTQLLAGVSGKAIVNVNSGGQVAVQHIAVGRHTGNASTFTVTGGSSFTNSDALTVHPGATLTAAASGLVQVQKTAIINGTVDVLGGVMTVGALGGPATIGAVTVNPGGQLAGSGTIKGNLIAKDPSGFPHITGARIKTGNSPGILTVEGNVSLETGSILELEIGGLTAGTEHDQLVATGSITFNGILDLAVVNSGSGFQLPGIGQQFTLLSAAGGLSGTAQNAAALRSVAGGSLVSWSIASGANNAVLQATSITPLLDGDYNGDGGVDAADYVVWRKAEGGINLAADGNRDGVINNLDFAVWRGNFGASAGSGSSIFSEKPFAPAVPEPATCVLLVIAAAGWCLRRGWAA